MKVLEKVELNHRTYFEQNGEDILAFRDRKSVEFYAARYLTRYASEWDIFADYSEDQRTIEEDDAICAWQRIADPQWVNTWQLAIAMPREPLPGTSEHSFIGAVLDRWSSCLSFSALFRPTLDNNRRPTELLWQCWPMFEFDPRRALDGRYRYRGKLVTGHELVEQGLADELHAMAKRQLLLDLNDTQSVSDAREECLTLFRKSSRQVVAEIEARRDKVLMNDGTRRPLPADKAELAAVLAEWQHQSHHEKSVTFLQCPPEAWINAYEADPTANDDPRTNAAIEALDDGVVQPVLMQATPVSRGMFYEFDPHFDTEEAIAYSLTHQPWQDFPMVDVDWFDAFVFCKWLGPAYRLPAEFEWELAARAGTQTNYHCGDRLSSDLANCDGGFDAGHSSRTFLKGCSPVGLERYPCNSWGLFDVHGNVQEWSGSWFNHDTFSRSLRGGSWIQSAVNCGLAERRNSVPGNRFYSIGFRSCLE